MKKMLIALPLVALIAACGGKGSSGGGSAQLKVVGSSTVYPFTTAVAEEFQRANPGVSVIVESTGTGAGIKLFCGGVGGQSPDMVNASRPMKASEYADCAEAGAKQVIEVPIGIDGLTLIQAKDQPPLNLTVAQIYKGLAANPFGKGPNTAQTWKDVDPSLPATKIRVLGPPPTSGTRDSLAELILHEGLRERPGDEGAEEEPTRITTRRPAPRSARTAHMSRRAKTTICSSRRCRPIRARLACSAIASLRKMPTASRRFRSPALRRPRRPISDLSYPGSRRLFIYVKGEHLRRQAGDQGVHRGLFEGLEQGRNAGEARPGAAEPAEAAAATPGDGTQAARPGEPEVSRGRRAP